MTEVSSDSMDKFMSLLKPTGWGKPPTSFDKMDDRNYPNATFTHHPDGQMTMRHAGEPDNYVHPGVKAPWAHTVQERPAPVGRQDPLPFEPTKATTPTDKALHNLRQQNPHLNDYQFKTHIFPTGGGSVAVFHHKDGNIANLDWEGHNPQPQTYSGGYTAPAKHPGEVGMIEVHADHRKKGLAEGMFDMATARGETLVHSSNRSEEGDAFARRVGGKRLDREEGKNTQAYGTSFRDGQHG